MTSSEMSKSSRPISESGRRRILGVDQIDDLGAAILTLTRELYVLTDRQLVLEAILVEQGLDLSALERFEPPPELQAKLNAKRDAMMLSVLRSLGAVE
jgi:hypothetical protein